MPIAVIVIVVIAVVLALYGVLVWFASTAFIPPGATSSALIASMDLLCKTGLRKRYLRELIRVGHVLVDEKPAPAALH